MENPTTATAPSAHDPGGSLLPTGPWAPWWHTLLLVLWIAFTSWSTATAMTAGAAPKSTMTSRYLQTILMQWIVVLYIWWGLRLRGRNLGDLIGRTWDSFEDVLLDLAIAAGFWIVSSGILLGVQKLLGLISQQSLKDRMAAFSLVAPTTARELALFFFVAFTAGFCEEIIFRGYLQRQFIFLTRNVWAGIAVSAAIFGLAHGYQGVRLMIVLACYGALFGTLAHLRRSLVPGMMAHAWQDSLTGTVLYFAKYLPLPK